ncbi:MFS transporter [Bacillus sp. AFS076308]|uniref:MFS transporter n=1 Tax=unclassified Bacillus (in: firmicutes) TaxID=185979 RepID=UPI000BF43967|nr:MULTISPECIES: MFS transporter [unclassified Bacillus (in: firmicutes)]PFO06701.1 MFS transporter [Bacillus sp. AFS076308]PGV52746.1 MFS transporter [Bacillus sp. AFS037270]
METQQSLSTKKSSTFLKVNPKYNYYLLLSIVFGGFLIFGLSENIKGPAIPIIQNELHLSQSQIGILLALNSLGYLLACSFTSALSNKIGIKWTGIIAFLSMALAGFVIYLSVNYATLSASFFLLYVGNGVLEIGLGIMAARIFTKNTGAMMNLSHFFYGLSSTVAPTVAASIMGWNMFGDQIGWRGMYLLVLLLSLLPIVPSLLGKFPKETHEIEETTSYKSLVRDPVAWLIVAVLSFGVVSEIAIGSWLVQFLVKAYSWNIHDASRMLSMFFLFFMLARLFLGAVTDKIGFTLSIIIASAFSGICSLAAILTGEKGAMLFAISGVGIALIYPTVMALLAKRYPKGTGAAITFTVTLMGIASVIGNLLIGFIIDLVSKMFKSENGGVNEILGLQAGYGFIAVLALICSGCSIVLYVILKKKNELI